MEQKEDFVQEQADRAVEFYDEHLVDVIKEDYTDVWYDNGNAYEVPCVNIALVCLNCRESFISEFGRDTKGEIVFLGGFIDGFSDCSAEHVDCPCPTSEDFLEEVDDLLGDATMIENPDEYGSEDTYL
jgi:hypothetical protein